MHGAEVPEVFLDAALDTLVMTPDDKEQIKRRKEWGFLCLELVEDDLSVTHDFCVDTCVVKMDCFVKYVMKSINRFPCKLYNKDQVLTESPQSVLEQCGGFIPALNVCSVAFFHLFSLD